MPTLEHQQPFQIHYPNSSTTPDIVTVYLGEDINKPDFLKEHGLGLVKNQEQIHAETPDGERQTPTLRRDLVATPSAIQLEQSSTVEMLSPLQSASREAGNRLAQRYAKLLPKGSKPDNEFTPGELARTVEQNASQHLQELQTPDFFGRFLDEHYGRPLVALAQQGDKIASAVVNLSLRARETTQTYEASSGFETPQKWPHLIGPEILQSLTGIGDAIDTGKQALEIIPSEDIYGRRHVDLINRVLGLIAAVIPIPLVTSVSVHYIRNAMEQSIERALGEVDPEALHRKHVARAELRVGRGLLEDVATKKK